VRAKLRDIPVILGSATPSLESLHNAEQGRYQLLDLPVRAGNAQTPKIEPLDIRGQELVAGLAGASRSAIMEQLAAGNQVLVFINRRGYAPALMCQQCGWTADCDHCDIPMTLHLARRHLRCHHCDLQRRLPEQCPDCHSRQLLSRGQGTEKLEQSLASEMHNYPVLRIDSDNMRSGNRLQAALEQVNSGQPCVLVGTQMLAKGHHFPNVTLVVIVDADSGLYSADFRSVERTGQLLIQVAGRAGRASKPGRVLLQTLQPDHPLLQPLLHQDYVGFCEQLLLQRKALGLPPFGYLAMIRCDAGEPELVSKLLQQACRENPVTPGTSRIGPLIAPMARKAGRFRYQLIIKSDQRALLHREAHQLVNWLNTSREARKIRWSVDIDPQDMS
jgi:primosomal protein N' (replication factor Y)